MNNILKIAVIGGSAYLLIKTLRVANTVKNLQFNPGKLYKNPSGPGFKFSLEVINPTDTPVTLDFPFITIKFNDTVLANSQINNKKIVLAAKQKTMINDISLSTSAIALATALAAALSNANAKGEVFARSAINGAVSEFKVTEFNLKALSGLMGLGEDWDGTAGKHAIKDGSQYDKYFPKSDGKDKIILPDASVYDTVEQMESLVNVTLSETEKIAPLLIGKNWKESLEKIWGFTRNHVQYKLDTAGQEELRRPRRTWEDRKTGVDCDCQSIFNASIIRNIEKLGVHKNEKIEVNFIVTKYQQGWQHVYLVCFVNNKPIVIDTVVDKFNYQKPYSDRFYYKMETLAGIPLHILSGIENDKNDEQELLNIVSGVDFNEVLLNESLQGAENEEALLGATYNHLARVHNYLVKNYKKHKIHPQKALSDAKMLGYLLENWSNRETREVALGHLIAEENRYNQMAGLGNASDDDLGAMKLFKRVATAVAPSKVAAPAAPAKKGIFNRVSTAVTNIVKANPIVRAVQRTAQTAKQVVQNRIAVADAKDKKHKEIMDAKRKKQVSKQTNKTKKRVSTIQAKEYKNTAKQQAKENKKVGKKLKKANKFVNNANSYAQDAAQYNSNSIISNEIPTEFDETIVPTQQQDINPYANAEQSDFVNENGQEIVQDEFSNESEDFENTEEEQEQVSDPEYNELQQEEPEDEEYIEDNFEEEEYFSGVLAGTAFNVADTGIGSVEDTEQVVLNGIHDHLVDTHNAFTTRFNNGKKTTRSAQTDLNYIKMLGAAIDGWDAPNRQEILDSLAEQENRLNVAMGVAHLNDDVLNGLGVPAKKSFFKKVANTVKNVKTKVKEAAQKVGTKTKAIAKKVGAAIVKYNPISLAVRGAYLLALRINLFKIAENLYPAYLTGAQAKSQGISPEKYNAAKLALIKIEKLFVGRLKGNSESLKKAITQGRAAKKIAKKGFNGIGAAGADDAVAILSAAAPIMASLATIKVAQATIVKARKGVSGSEILEDTLLGVEYLLGLGTTDELKADAAEATAQAEAAGEITGKPMDAEQKEKFAGALTKFIGAVKKWFAARKAGKDPNATVSPDGLTLTEDINNAAATDKKGTDEDKPDEEKGFLKSIGDFVMENPLASVATAATVTLVVSPAARRFVGIGKSKNLSGLAGTTKKSTSKKKKQSKVKMIALK